jgi:hypothetical protein
VIRRWFHFSCRVLALAAVIMTLVLAGGCAMFHKEFWSMDRYRDERAVDIDHRLNDKQPIVKNPF